MYKLSVNDFIIKASALAMAKVCQEPSDRAGVERKRERVNKLLDLVFGAVITETAVFLVSLMFSLFYFTRHLLVKFFFSCFHP